jgi:hypothetical protein
MVGERCEGDEARRLLLRLGRMLLSIVAKHLSTHEDQVSSKFRILPAS